MIIIKITENTLKELAQKSYQDFVHNGSSEKETKEALRDIVTRYKRDKNMGGYSADEIVGFLYFYFYEIHCKFRNYYREGIIELIEEKKKLTKQLTAITKNK